MHEVDSHEHTPAAVDLVARWRDGDLPGALEVIDEHWMEIWYAFDPVSLRPFFEQLPEDVPVHSGVHFLATLVGVQLPTPPPTTPTAEHRPSNPAKELTAVGQQIVDLRLAGKPQAAMALFPRVAETAQELRGRLLDSSGGRYSLWLIQGGITALLAGDLVAAKAAFLEATGAHRPDRFPFVNREAAAKLALAHAVSGQITEATRWSVRGRQLPRTSSWVEAFVDDSLWIADYMCAVDSLDFDRAEEMRLANPSPLVHLEFWGVALLAQVRHLVLTDRRSQAAELCDEVAAVGLPLPGSDGWLAQMLDDARLMCLPVGSPVAPASGTAAEAIAHRMHLLATGQYTLLTAPSDVEVAEPDGEGRSLAELRLLRGQGMLHADRSAEGRHLLSQTLSEVFSRGTLGSLRMLSADTLALIGDDEHGRHAAEVVSRHRLGVVETRAVLDAPLTPAEINVLRMLGNGLSRIQMAEQLFVSVETVKSQLRSAYRKLGVRNRDEATAKASQLGL